MGMAPSTPLQDWTSQELSIAVESLGGDSPTYKTYAQSIIDNGVDGALLEEFSDQEFAETLIDLQITNRLHGRVLTKEWKKKKKNQQTQKKEEGQSPKLNQEQIQEENDGSPLTATTTNAAGTNDIGTMIMNKRLSSVARSSIPFDRRSSIVAIESLQLSPFMTNEDLQGFEAIADKLYTKGGSTFYAGIHLWDPDGDLAISSVYQQGIKEGGENEVVKENWIHHDKSLSICHEVMMIENDDDYVVRQVEPGTYPIWPQLNNSGGQYQGYVFRDPDTGAKIGMLCTFSNTSSKNNKNEEKRENGTETTSTTNTTTTINLTDAFNEEEIDRLKQLAFETEYQVQLRKTLLARNNNLSRQVQDSKATLFGLDHDFTEKEKEEVGGDQIKGNVLPSFGPIKCVTQSQVDNRPSYFPYPEELKRTGRRRSSIEIPEVAKLLFKKKNDNNIGSDNNNNGNADEWGDMLFSAGTEEGTPLSPDEMARIAMTESLGISELTPDHPTGIAIKKLIEMAGELFQVEHAELTTLDLEHQRGLARYVRSGDYSKTLADVFHFVPTKFDTSGHAWVCSMKRGQAMCNYPIALHKTFVVHDIAEDDTFAHLSGFRFYAGSPVIIRDQAVACICMTDTQPRPDFTKAHEIQLEHVALLVSHQIDNWILRREMEQLEKEREMLLLTQHRANGGGNGNNGINHKSSMPERHAALIFTDIQGSTALWEANPEAMSDALALHDSILRKQSAENSGYEVKTEGDAFHIAFHDAVDAVKFALVAQEELYKAPWSEELLALPDACEDGKGCFRGLRVRMAIHYGKVTSRDNQTSGTREYCGPTYHTAKSLEHMCHGGQILVTDDVWKITSYVANTSLQSPQVLDLGVHVLMNGANPTDGIIAKNVLQLVPATLAFDYVTNRTLPDGNCWEGPTTAAATAKGREFPPVLSKKQLSTCFHDAPYKDNRATIVFINTTEVEKHNNDPSVVLSALAKLIGAILREHGTGYQCRNFKLSFHTPSDAVAFGLKLQEALTEGLVLDQDLSELVKVGVLEGKFMSMGPHPQSGRAEYNGRLVNRAARVASAAAPGSVYLGAMNMEEKPSLDDGLVADFLCTQAMKGVQEEMALFECRCG